MDKPLPVMPGGTPQEPILRAENLRYSYWQGPQEISVFRGVNFQLFSRERVALIGASGTGKSTFLHLLGLLDLPQAGEVRLMDHDNVVSTHTMTDQQRTLLRGHLLGFIYQFHQLLEEFTALENVMMPQLILGVSKKMARHRAEFLLQRVGLAQRIHHLPSQLSGGQQQRVAIARALANQPSILLADEPTGNLDHQSAQEVLELLYHLGETENLSILMATHNPDLYQNFHRVVSIQDGTLQELTPSPDFASASS